MNRLLIALPLLAAVLAVVPWVASDTIVQYGINALLVATLAQGWNIIGGFSGYPSFGNSVFYGLGTYGTAIAMAQLHWSFGSGLVLGAAILSMFIIALAAAWRPLRRALSIDPMQALRWE